VQQRHCGACALGGAAAAAMKRLCAGCELRLLLIPSPDPPSPRPPSYDYLATIPGHNGPLAWQERNLELLLETPSGGGSGSSGSSGSGDGGGEEGERGGKQKKGGTQKKVLAPRSVLLGLNFYGCVAQEGVEGGAMREAEDCAPAHTPSGHTLTTRPPPPPSPPPRAQLRVCARRGRGGLVGAARGRGALPVGPRPPAAGAGVGRGRGGAHDEVQGGGGGLEGVGWGESVRGASGWRAGNVQWPGASSSLPTPLPTAPPSHPGAPQDGGKRRQMFYPTPASLAARVELARKWGAGLSIWVRARERGSRARSGGNAAGP
jgi:hypothetical protein